MINRILIVELRRDFDLVSHPTVVTSIKLTDQTKLNY